ncbi:hypothetical protein HYX08_02415 [Candidatus Woesearchaeota archaeon]|nr:hypothetical protein [Candidatus Woesearchaeota archaeon]
MKTSIIFLMAALLLAPAIMAAGLQITEIDVNVDYDEAYTYRVENRDRIDSASVAVANGSKIGVDILPGSNVTFTIRVENTFTGEDPEIRGVFVTTSIKEIDDGSDLDEESLDFDLEPGGDYRFDVKFHVPLDAEAGTYDTSIEAEGEDRNGTSYNTEVTLKLEVKKQSHDIRISNVLLSPSTIDCDRKARLTAEIVNAGSNAENQVALEFKSGNLGINSFDRDISLESSGEASDEEKTHTKTLSIEVPSFMREGTYPIFINLYWKNFVLFDQKTADLVVKDCSAGSVQQQPSQGTGKKQETVTVVQPESEDSSGISTSTESTSLSTPVEVFMLAGGIAILALAVLAVFGYLRSKPR